MTNRPDMPMCVTGRHEACGSPYCVHVQGTRWWCGQCKVFFDDGEEAVARLQLVKGLAGLFSLIWAVLVGGGRCALVILTLPAPLIAILLAYGGRERAAWAVTGWWAGLVGPHEEEAKP